jgi:hypothetical protein
MRKNWRTWLLTGAIVIGALASVLFMKPTLIAPVGGDDRVLYPSMGAYDSWTPLNDLATLPDRWQSRTHNGRVNLVSEFERRTAARAVVETSAASGVTAQVVQGALKLLLTLMVVLTMTALVRSLRWRRRDGALVRVSGPTVLLCTLAGGVLFAVGSQPRYAALSGRNAWVSYPVHTYGAVVSIFGVVALLLWLTRLYAEGRYRIPIVILLVLLALLTNFRYELVFTAVPLALIALLVVPVASGDRAAEGRRAKWVTGLAYVGVFLPVFVALRWYLRGQCESGNCYNGVTLSLTNELWRTFYLNVVSAVPGVGTRATTHFVDAEGVSTAGMYTPTPFSVLVAGGMALAMLVCWWLTRPSQPAPSQASREQTANLAQGPDEGRMLAIGAGLCLLGLLGAALVMSLSEAAQEGMKLGQLYRHTVVAWAATAWALVLGILALGRWWPKTGAVAWLALAVATAVIAAVQLPASERSLTADREMNQATMSAFAALASGDVSSKANAYRCRLVPKILQEQSYSEAGAKSTVNAFDAAYRRYWGQGFCER